MGTDIEVLAAGNCILRKERQPRALRVEYQDKFELD
jgi:carbamoyltransferase